MKLRVLGISGSPRKGNSEFLLEQAVSGAAEYPGADIETEIYSFRNKHFEPCIACGHCIRKQGSCIHKDDFDDLRSKWLEADVIIYSLPVYHMTMPGQVKCFIDRLGNASFGSHKVVRSDGSETLSKQMKTVGTIAQGIHMFSGQEHTITDMINHALIMQSVPVTGDMWESYIGTGAWTCNQDARNAMDSLYEKQEFSVVAAVRSARLLGRRCVEQADIILKGLLASRETLSKDPAYHWIYSRLDKKLSGAPER